MELITTNSGQTQAVARRLGRVCFPHTLLLLSGPLGAGKTCFVQGLAAGLNIEDMVNSPTFTIAKMYHGRLPLWHLDLYRLEDGGELWELGLEEFLAAPGVVVIEWPDVARGLLPHERLEIAFDLLDENRRRLDLMPFGEQHSLLAEELMRDAAAGR